MSAYIADKELIRQQPMENNSKLATNDFGPGITQTKGWNKYFKELMTHIDHRHYDS